MVEIINIHERRPKAVEEYLLRQWLRECRDGMRECEANWQGETFAWFNREPGSDNSSLSFEPWCALGGTPGIRRRPFDDSELFSRGRLGSAADCGAAYRVPHGRSHARNDEGDPDPRADDRCCCSSGASPSA